MGAINSAQRDSKRDTDTSTEPSTGTDGEPGHSDEDKLLRKNGQISSLNGKTESQSEESNGPTNEEMFLAGAGSRFVTLNEDGTETAEDFQGGDTSQTNTEEMSKETLDADGVTVKDDDETDKQKDTEVGFKKIFRFVGFKFTVKNDKNAQEPYTNDHYKKTEISSEDSTDTKGDSPICTNEQDAEEILEDITGDIEAESMDGSILPETENEMAVSQISDIKEHNKEMTPDKGQIEVATESPDPEEPMSPIKRFFTQGIFASLRKKRKEDVLKDNEEEELEISDKQEGKNLDTTGKQDSTCACLDISNITHEDNKHLQSSLRGGSKPASEGQLMNSQEQDKVPASPLKRLFTKLSTRRQREIKPTQSNLTEPVENWNEKPQSSAEEEAQTEEDKAMMEEPKPVEEDQIKDLSPDDSKKKSDSTLSWESLICIGSTKKRARRISDSEDATQDKGEVPRKTTESPLESSTEGDYDHLTSSNEQAGSNAEEENGSTWKSLRKLVTPKRKSKTEESGLSEWMPLDTENNKEESLCSIKKFIPGHKKRRSGSQQEQTYSDEAGKDTGTDNEDDETPVIVPLSEYEITEPESLKEMPDVTELKRGVNPMTEEDKIKETMPQVPSLCDERPTAVSIPSEYIEDLTEFISKHQQLSDIPEEGLIEESVATPVSSDEWTTQDDTIAEDIVELTADAVTAPEPATEQFDEDESTEMVSAVSQLTESPKTSGNVTPVPPNYELREADRIIQEAIETICMTPSVMSLTTKDDNPMALAVSVSPCVVESNITSETKVVVAYEKAKATSICTGLVSQEIVNVVKDLPVHLLEGISEVSGIVPTEMVSEDLAEGAELAGLKTDGVYEAEVKEINTEMHILFLPDEHNKHRVDSKKDTDVQAELMEEEKKDKVSLVVQPEEVNYIQNECTTKALNVENLEVSPVQMAVVSEMQVETLHLEEQFITTNVNETMTQNLVVSESHATIDNTSEITEAVAGVLASVLKSPEPAGAFSTLSPFSNSIKLVPAVLENEVQMENVPSVHLPDRYEIQEKVQDTDFEIENSKLEAVCDVATAVNETGICETEVFKGGETTQQQVESITAGESGEKNAEETKVENLLGIVTEPDEIGLDITTTGVPYVSVTTTNESSEVEKLKYVSEIKLNPEIQHEKININSVEDYQKSTEKISYTLTINKAPRQMENIQAPAICEQKEETENEGCQLLTTEKFEGPQPENKPPDKSLDTHNTNDARDYAEKSSLTKRIFIDAALFPEDGAEHKEETILSGYISEIVKESHEIRESDETVGSSTQIEPQFNTEQLQIDIIPLKPEGSQEKVSCLQLCKEIKHMADDILNVTITSEENDNIEEMKESPVVLSSKEGSNETNQTFEEKTDRGKLVKSEQTMATVQSIEATSCEDSVIDTTVQTVQDPLAVRQEPEVSITPEACEPLEEIKHFMEELHESVNEDKDEIKTEEDTDTPCETEQGEITAQEKASTMDKEPVITIFEAVMPVSTGEDRKTQIFSEHKMETLEIMQPEMQTKVKNALTPEILEVREPQVETNVVTAKAVVTEADGERPVVTPEAEAERPVVASGIPEAEVERPVLAPEIPEAEVERPILASEIQVAELERPVVTSEIPEAELEPPVVTSEIPEAELERPVVTSEIPEAELERPVVTSEIQEAEVERTVVTSEIQEAEVERTVVTPKKPEAEVERPVVASEIPEAEVERPVVTPAIPEAEVERPVVTSEIQAAELERPVVASEIQAAELERPVVTSEIPETEVESPVLMSEMPEAEVERPVLMSEMPEAEVERQVVTPEIQKAEVERPVVMSEMPEAEVERPVLMSEMPEAEVERQVVIPEIQKAEVERPVLMSEMPEAEVERLVVTPEIPEAEVEKPVVTSEIPEAEVERQVVMSEIPEAEVERPVVMSKIPEAERHVVTPEIPKAEVERLVVMSEIPEAEVERPVVMSKIPEAERHVVTTEIPEAEIERQVVTPEIPEAEVERQVVTPEIPQAKVERPVVAPEIPEAEVERPVVASEIQSAEVERLVVMSEIPEAEIERPVVMSKIPEAERHVVTPEAEVERQVVTPDIPEAEVERPVVASEIQSAEVERPVVAPEIPEAEVERPVVASEIQSAEVERPVVMSEMPEAEVERPVVMSEIPEAEVERPVVTSDIPEAEAERQVVTPEIPEAEVVRPIVASEIQAAELERPVVASEIQSAEVERPVVAPEIPEAEVERPVVASEIQSAEVERPVVMSEMPEAEVERPVVMSEIPEAEVERPVVMSGITEAEVERQVVTPEIPEAEAERQVVASEIPETEVESPVVTSVVTKAEVESPVVASVLTEAEVESPVVASVVTEAEVECPVLTSVVTETEVESPVVASVVTEAEVESPVLTSVVTETEVESPVVASVVTKAEVESPFVASVVTETEVESPVVTSMVTGAVEERPILTSVKTEPELQTGVLTSEITEAERETQVMTSAAKKLNDNTNVMAPVIQYTNMQVMLTGKQPAATEVSTLEEIADVERETKTATMKPELQTTETKEEDKLVSDKNNAKVYMPAEVELTKPKLEISIAAEAVIHTAVSELEEQTPLVTSALGEQHVSSFFTSVVKESQSIKSVVPIHIPAATPLVQEPEVPVKAPNINETNTPTIYFISPKIIGPEVTEAKAEKAEVTEVDVKISTVTSVVTELDVIPIKTEEKGGPTYSQVIQTSMDETPANFPAVEKPKVVQTPSTAPMVQAPADDTAVILEAPVLKGSHTEVSVAVEVEVEIQSLAEAEVKVSEENEEITQNVESAAESKGDKECFDTVCQVSKEVVVSMATETPQEVEDDVWEDAVDDIIVDEVSITKSGAEFQDDTH